MLSYVTALSSLAFWFSAWVLYKRAAWTLAWEISQLVVVGAVSTIYHFCDAPDIGLCLGSFATLRTWDVFVSYNALASLVSPWLLLAPLHGEAWRCVHQTGGFLLTFGLTAWDASGDLAVLLPPLVTFHGVAWIVALVVTGEWRTLRRGWFLTTCSACLAGLAVGIMIYSGDMQPDDDRYEWAHALGWHVPLALAFAAVTWLYPGAECRQCDWIRDELLDLHEKTALIKELTIAKEEELISSDAFLELLDKLLPGPQADDPDLSPSARD
jgi:hypothetical protein